MNIDSFAVGLAIGIALALMIRRLDPQLDSKWYGQPLLLLAVYCGIMLAADIQGALTS